MISKRPFLNWILPFVIWCAPSRQCIELGVQYTVPGTHPPLLPPAPTNGQVASLSHGCAVVLGFTQQPSVVTNEVDGCLAPYTSVPP